MKILIYNDFSLLDNSANDYHITIWIPIASNTGFIINSLVTIFQNKYKNTQYFLEKCFSISNINIKYKSIECRSNESVHTNSRIAIYTQSDTLSSSIIPILNNLEPSQYKVFIPVFDKEGAYKPLSSNNIEFETLSKKALITWSPSIILLLNDWSKIARGILSIARMKKIPSICLQESIINFGDTQKRMERSDYVMVQGLKTIQHLEHDHYILTGNPRYTPALSTKKTKRHILINCNFTYNVEEANRALWLDQVVTTLNKINKSYIILQHPRDTGNLNKYDNVVRSSSSIINEYMIQGSTLISRFSSLLHESIVNHIPAIYYNPHGEKLTYDFEPDQKVMFYNKDVSQLEETLLSISLTKRKKEDYNQYLIKHCYNPEIDTPRAIAELLKRGNYVSKRATLSDNLGAYVYAPAIRQKVDALKRFYKN